MGCVDVEASAVEGRKRVGGEGADVVEREAVAKDSHRCVGGDAPDPIHGGDHRAQGDAPNQAHDHWDAPIQAHRTAETSEMAQHWVDQGQQAVGQTQNS